MPTAGIVAAPRSEVLRFEEIAEVVRVFAAAGVERVRLTGGEPTVRRNLCELVAVLTQIVGPTGRPISVVMTTNAALLATLAGPLRAAGLAGLTVSVDSLCPQRFAAITRRGDLSQVLAGITAATAAGFSPIKLNTVAVRGFNDDELGKIALWAWDHGHVPRFIEVMPMAEGQLYLPGELMPAAEIRARIAAAVGATVVPDSGDGLRGLGPATYWRIAAGSHAGKRFGVIAAMTENFCAGCNRLRLSATGQLHNCLARDDTGDLRSCLRPLDRPGLARKIRAILGHKQQGHEFQADGRGGPTKAMIGIGG